MEPISRFLKFYISHIPCFLWSQCSWLTSPNGTSIWLQNFIHQEEQSSLFIIQMFKLYRTRTRKMNIYPDIHSVLFDNMHREQNKLYCQHLTISSFKDANSTNSRATEIDRQEKCSNILGGVILDIGNILEYLGNILGIYWNILEYLEISWNILEYHGISWEEWYWLVGFPSIFRGGWLQKSLNIFVEY